MLVLRSARVEIPAERVIKAECFETVTNEEIAGGQTFVCSARPRGNVAWSARAFAGAIAMCCCPPAPAAAEPTTGCVSSAPVGRQVCGVPAQCPALVELRGTRLIAAAIVSQHRASLSACLSTFGPTTFVFKGGPEDMCWSMAKVFFSIATGISPGGLLAGLKMLPHRCSNRTLKACSPYCGSTEQGNKSNHQTRIVGLLSDDGPQLEKIAFSLPSPPLQFEPAVFCPAAGSPCALSLIPM